MTVAELIEALSNFDPSTEVVLAHQPHWPVDFAIGGVVDGREVIAPDDLDDDDPDQSIAANRIYLVEGNQLGYGLAAVHNAV